MSKRSLRQASICALVAFSLIVPALAQNGPARAKPALAGLVEILLSTDDPQVQLDLLKGLSEAARGRRQLPMPARWGEVETKLGQSANPEVQALTQLLSLTFGSSQALQGLKAKATDPAAPAPLRRTALEALLGARDASLPPMLVDLLRDPALRPMALRGLAAYDFPGAAPAILPIYPELNRAEKKDALNTLASRVPYAKALLEAVGKHAIAANEISPDVLRQLRNLKNPEISGLLEKVWGVARESGADKKKEIERYKTLYWAGGSQPGEASRGRLVFSRLCQQCHTLFDTGGKVGPDLTGSNRADLEYILQNMVDPNAVIPNEYRSSTLETKDERVLTGIVKKQDDKTVTIVTVNENLVLPMSEVKSLQQSDISMMPEGLLAQLSDQEIRDLIYYLSRPGQVPLPASQP